MDIENRGGGGKKGWKISGENNKARLLEMKRMSGVLASERMTEQRVSFLHFCVSHHIPTCLSGFRERWEEEEARSEIRVSQKPSRASHLHTKWPREENIDGGKPVSLNYGLCAFTACPPNEQQKEKKKRIRELNDICEKVTLTTNTQKWFVLYVFTDAVALSNHESRGWWPRQDISGAACETSVALPSVCDGGAHQTPQI